MSQPITRDYQDPEVTEVKDDVTDTDDVDEEVIVVRAEIEQTRDEMSDTIDAIQERLNPQVLMQQAKEAAQETVQEKVDQAKDTVRQATIGKVEDAMNTAGEKVQEAMSSAGEVISSVPERIQGAMGSGTQAGDTMQSVQGTVSGNASGLVNTIKQNPLPALLAAAGLGWLYISSRQQNASRGTVRYATGTQGTAYPTTYYTERPLSGSTGVYAGQPQSGTIGTYPERTLSGSTNIYTGQYPTGNTGSYADQSRNGEAGGSGGVSQTLKSVPQTAGQVASKAQDTVGQLGSKAQETVGQLGSQAQQARGTINNLLVENPIAVGVAIAGLGMLAGLAVPETEKENELMGQAHEALMDKAEQVAQETAQRVQDVAQNAAQQAIQNVAKEAINAVKQGVQE
jgi:ElaB/YqjD/DUF883 family membrane-anchored ribosome-binding protein